MKKDKALAKRELLAVLSDLKRFAISVAGNVSDGDDLLQATVERVLARGVPLDADMKKWVFRVCKNIWIDDYRAKQVRLRAVEDIRLEKDVAPDGETLAHNRIMLSRAKKLIEVLPDDQRMVMTLVSLEGYSYKEVADILDTPIGTVMSRLSRARKAIGEQMRGFEEERG